MDAPEVVVGLLPHHRVREDEHGAHDGEQRDARKTRQRLQETAVGALYIYIPSLIILMIFRYMSIDNCDMINLYNTTRTTGLIAANQMICISFE